MTAANVSLLPDQTGSMLPAPTVDGLTYEEQALMSALSSKLMLQTFYVQQKFSYYDGTQRLQNLGISIPPQLAGVRTVVDWPRICVDPLVQRAQVAGFRLPSATDVDSELGAMWNANDMDSELPLALLDSLVAGRGYLIVGAPDSPGDAPLVTVESPLNIAVSWDPRTRQITAAFQAYQVQGVYRAVLYMPNQTIEMSREQTTQWAIDDIDVHNFGEVPVVRLPNRARSSDREGRSEITNAVMNTTDSAVRSLLGMEIAREVYSIPRMWIIGASESAFVNGAGQPKPALDVAMTKVLGLERDEEGLAPEVGQFDAFDPSVFTKIIDEHAQLMASYTGFPPSYFGQTTTANPASADAIRVSLNGLDNAGRRVQQQTTAGMRKVAQLMWRFANNGDTLPADLRQIEVDWIDSATETPAATSDAITKQIAAGVLPPRSDVTQSRLGYTPTERSRLAQDYDTDPTAQLIEEAGDAALGKALRTLSTLTKALQDDETPAVAPPAAEPAAD